MEKRKRGASGFILTRRSAPPRVRHFKADSGPLRRRSEISRYLALSVAASFGEARLDRWPMGREGGSAPPAILQANPGRPSRTAFEAAKLERFRGCDQQNYRD